MSIASPEFAQSLPPTPFDVRRVVPVTVSRQALIRFDGVEYSVPAEWARLDATAYIGVDTIDIHCLGEQVTVERVQRGKRHVKYRHYLKELFRKPQALPPGSLLESWGRDRLRAVFEMSAVPRRPLLLWECPVTTAAGTSHPDSGSSCETAWMESNCIDHDVLVS